MSRLAPLSIAFLLLGPGLAWALGLEGPRPMDPVLSEARDAPIPWQGGWQATYEACVKLWTQELVDKGVERRERLRILARRMIRLLEAIAAKYPDDAEAQIFAREKLAGYLDSAGMAGNGNYELKKLVDGFPGRPDLAAAWLQRILGETSWDRPYKTDEGPAWIDYAAERALALNRAGALSDRHPAVVLALKATVVLRALEGRLLEAAEALDRLQPILGEEEWAALRDRIAPPPEEATGSPPSVPSSFGPEMQWASARGEQLDVMLGWVDRIIEGDRGGRTLIPWGKARYTSLWAAVDRYLLDQDPAGLLPLREASDRAAKAAPGGTSRGDDAARLAAFRRHPWATASHRALVASGEAALRRGHAGLAARSFEDALRHASDPAVREQARVGLWLALAQEPGWRGLLERAFEGVPPDALYPWMGTPTPARVIRERLTAPPADAPARPRGSLGLVRLRLPPVPAWPAEVFEPGATNDLSWAFAAAPDVRACGPGVLVSGPDLLVCFDGAGRPAWRRGPRSLGGVQGDVDADFPHYVTAPGLFRPAIADGRVTTRWGLDPSRRLLTGLAAFDARTGEMLWSTATDPAWQDMWPVGDPAVAGGRVYVLTVLAGYSEVVPMVPAHLVCLDGASGRLLWKRQLASQGLPLPRTDPRDYRALPVDLVHYGNAVTVDAGAVYCQTNLGFVARCDARDGVVEWLRSYARPWVKGDPSRTLRRMGAAPVAVGDRVVFVPRDREGAFAVDRQTGRLLWDNPCLPADTAAGTLGDAVLLADSHTVAAVDAATGKPRWHRCFAEGLRAGPVLDGSSLHLATAAGAVHLDAATGHTLGSTPWGGSPPLEALAAWDGGLVGVSAEPTDLERGGVGKPLNPDAAAPAGPLRLPLQQSWCLPRPDPRIIVPPAEAEAEGRLYLLSEGVLECVEMSARGSVLWRRLLRPGYRRLAWARGLLLVIDSGRVTAVDAATGALRWQMDPPLPIRRFTLAPPCLLLFTEGDGGDSWRASAVDLGTGELRWSRGFGELAAIDSLDVIGAPWDGKLAHLLTRGVHQGPGYFDVQLRPADGQVEAISPFIRDKLRKPLWLLEDAGAGFYMTEQGRTIYSLTLDGRKPETRHNATVAAVSSYYGGYHPRLTGPWLQLAQHEAVQPFRKRILILRCGDPAYELRTSGIGTVRGDRFYQTDEDALTVIDLPTRRQVVRYAISTPPGQSARILDFQPVGDAMVVVSGLEASRRRYGLKLFGVQVDVFDSATGRPLASQVLRDVPYWRVVRHTSSSYIWERVLDETQAAWGDGMLFLTDMGGLRAFVPAPADYGPPEKPVHVAYRLGRPVAVDGALAEWDLADVTAVATDTGARGEVALAHDDADLAIAVACPDRDPRPRCGLGDAGGGDWLEVGLTAGRESWRWGVGADSQGRVVSEGLGDDGVPRGLRAAIRYDPARQSFVYELAIPLRALSGGSDEGQWDRIGISLAAWDDRAGEGTVASLRWGGGIAGRATMPDAHETVLIHPLTRSGEQAGLAIARQLPGLPEARAYLDRIRALRPDASPAPAPAAAPADLTREKVVPVLQEQIPRLGPTGEAWAFFNALLRYQQPDARGSIQWLTWFLKTFPDHPKAAEALGRLLDAYRAVDAGTAVESVRAAMDACHVPLGARYEYNREHNPDAHARIQSWLILGPFPNPGGRARSGALPPETEPVDLAKAYAGARGPVRWRVERATASTISLDRALDWAEPGVAYAVCWVHLDRAEPATLLIGHDDGCKAWVNRKLVHDRTGGRHYSQVMYRVPVALGRGWNELLLRIDQTKGKWVFCAELVDREGVGIRAADRVAPPPPEKP